MIRRSLRPSERAAWTYSSSLAWSTFPLSSLAVSIQSNAINAMMTLSSPLPSMVVRTITAIRKGMDMKISVIRMRISSTTPR